MSFRERRARSEVCHGSEDGTVKTTFYERVNKERSSLDDRKRTKTVFDAAHQRLFVPSAKITRTSVARGGVALPRTMSEAAADVKRARTMPDDASDTAPLRITQALGADETHSMRDLFASWGLPARFHEGMAPQWRCRLVPMASDEATQRDMVCAGVPFLAPVEHARGVFDAMRGEDEKRGGGGGGEEKTRDGVSWACDAAWNAFPRPKVAMVGGWGAPGSHLLSERHMRMVSSFSEVVDGEEPLNLQMFHRGDGSRVPALPEKLDWPLPEFFSATPHPEVAEAVRELEERRASRTREEEEEDALTTPLPAQGASRGVGGVGVPLDTATRLSAAGALTWWHLDDCGEFVFQVGLPLDSTLPRRPNAKREPPRLLLGPTGKPVVKLFVFAEKKDYEWIAQDGAMNATSKQSALDLFDTPARCVPSEREMREASGGTSIRAETDEASTRLKTAFLPTFWVAPLEAGGPPLLSPPNVIHCVITARDCVMVEARRVSLAFLDEVEYFRKRAARWCEPPVQYRFVREDLVDAEKCRVGAAMPLAKLMRDTHARLMAFEETKEEASEDAARDASALAKTLARLAHSARVLLDGDPNAYALDPATRAWLKREVDACSNTSLSNTSLGSFAARDAFAADERATRLKALVDAMAEEGARGAHRIGAVDASVRRLLAARDGGDVVVADEGDVAAPFLACAVVHERGRPRWGPARATVEETVADRKAMRAAIKAGALDEWLRRLREPTREES